jgi:hypothetical protein
MIVRDARNKIAVDHILATYDRYKIGTGGDSTNPNATDLDSDISGLLSTRFSATTSDESTIEFKFTVEGSGFVGNTIKEVGLFNTDGSSMLLRVNYDGIGPLTSTDEIEFIIVVEVD